MKQLFLTNLVCLCYVMEKTMVTLCIVCNEQLLKLCLISNKVMKKINLFIHHNHVYMSFQTTITIPTNNQYNQQLATSVGKLFAGYKIFSNTINTNKKPNKKPNKKLDISFPCFLSFINFFFILLSSEIACSFSCSKQKTLEVNILISVDKCRFSSTSVFVTFLCQSTILGSSIHLNLLHPLQFMLGSKNLQVLNRLPGFSLVHEIICAKGNPQAYLSIFDILV